MPTKTLLSSLVIVSLALSAARAREESKLTQFNFSQPHMGTLFRISLYAPNEAAATNGADAAYQRVAQLDNIMSDYKPASELMRLCKGAGGAPVEISLDLAKVLERAEEIARQTEGAFDVSISPVVKLWRKARRTRVLPDPMELKRALEMVDYRKIKLDPMRRTVQLLIMGMLLDLGGIAKGYAADAALEALRQQGLTRASVAAGGDIAVGDPPPDAKGWKIGIAALKDPDGPPTHWLLLRNAALSTSGDSEQFTEIDGKRYSHIMDPKTGLGLVGRRSVTVIAPNGLTSDPLATALAVMGRDAALKFLDARPELAGLLVYEIEGIEVTTATKNFAKYLHPDSGK